MADLDYSRSAAGNGPAPLGTGSLLPSQAIRRMVERGIIHASVGIQEDQIQPASLDLRLSNIAYQVQASFLPGRNTAVKDMIERYAMQEIDLARGVLLQKGCVYVVRVLEELHLPDNVFGIVNPKSSIGRLNVFTRIITDGCREFDQIRGGYGGPLYAEIAPLAFSIIARVGSRLNQMRFKTTAPYYEPDRLQQLHSDGRDIDATLQQGAAYRGGTPITVDTHGDAANGIIGFRARKNTPAIDVDKRDHYEPRVFWDPIIAGWQNALILDPEEFYILASREAVAIPPDQAAELVAYDPLVGEFRVHYAGFFDPAFGHQAGGGDGSTRAVLEVRSHDVPFVIQDGQIVGRLLYEPLIALPDKVYSTGIGSAYQKQGLALSKHFKSAEHQASMHVQATQR